RSAWECRHIHIVQNAFTSAEEASTPDESPTEEVPQESTEEEQSAADEAAPPERNTMEEPAPATNGHKPAVEKTSMELAFEQVENTKTALRQARDGLNTL